MRSTDAADHGPQAVRSNVRTTAEKTQVAIREAATEIFGNRGYRTSTLEDIGARVGLTRGSVLHHFSSKAELLAAVTESYLRGLETLLDGIDEDRPTTDEQQRTFVGALVDLLLEHRGAVRLLANDVAARAELGLDAAWAGSRSRLITALFGADPSIGDDVRAAAALGAVSQPIAGSWLDLDDAATRSELIEAALRVAGHADRVTRARTGDGLAVAR
jgi:AcrR family transcriptional regulator